MIKHIFMCPRKQGCTDEEMNAVVTALRSLADTVPEIASLAVNRNLGLYDQKMDVVLVAEFANESAWQAYMHNPDHLRVGKFLSNYLDFPAMVVAQIAV